jgi:hypothetical protein
MLRFYDAMVMYTVQQVVQFIYVQTINSVCGMAINCHMVYKNLNKASRVRYFKTQQYLLFNIYLATTSDLQNHHQAK